MSWSKDRFLAMESRVAAASLFIPIRIMVSSASTGVM
jgi:hypothetical protein